MKRRLLLTHILFVIAHFSFSQSIGIGTANPHASAALDITNTSKGLLIPRMNTASIFAIASPAKGLLVYDSLTNQLMVNSGSAAAPNWQPIAPPANGWNPSGNIFLGLRAGLSNTTGYSNIGIGTDALKLNTANANMIAIGDSALYSNNAAANTAVGSKALFANTTGSGNIALGNQSLYFNTTGSVNTGLGGRSLFSNTTGRFNIALGYAALHSNTTADANSAIGYQSLYTNITGHDNTSTGFQSLHLNNIGSHNTANGAQALFANTSGTYNTAIGKQALYSNTNANGNTALGYQALYSNITGSGNLAAGQFALHHHVSGHANIGLGSYSLYKSTSAQYNVAIGQEALGSVTTSQFNTAIGYSAGSLYDLGYNNTFVGAYAYANQHGIFNSVAIGESSVCTGSNQVRLGNLYTSSIGGIVGYSNLSDGRYKKNIQDGVKGIDFIMKLRPVTYQMDIDGINNKINTGKKPGEASRNTVSENDKAIFSGFIAQEVEQAAKEAGYNFSGVDKPKNSNDMYALRYSEFVVPLVKAMQEQQRMIEELTKKIAELEKNKK